MSPDNLELLGLVAIVVAGLWARHEWHVRRFPDRACRSCGGGGKVSSRDVLGRKVLGPCRRCGGQRPTTPRRWSRQ